uniref:SH3 and PX domain-containing protein 2A n=1 Tax=Electrophorus electricus TaxID=8005 RepID=A0AAY5EHW5_ELEEL
RRAPDDHQKVYLINVTYSDSTSHIIYRRYSKFFDLQMQILDKFPIEGGQKDPKKRIIPFLPGKILFRRSHVRDVAMKRLRFIDDYCRALVRLPPQISQSEEVLRFFETKPDDINPPVDVLIMLLHLGQKKPFSIGEQNNLIQTYMGLDGGEPMVLEQYVAVASYERQENSEISLRAGETVDVIEKSESGWWFVSTVEEQGWVPATYLDAQTGTRDDLDLEEKYISVQSYASQGKDEIGFEKGVTVEVIQKNLEGWWYIRHLGKEGWAPASYLKKLKDDLSPRKKTLTGPVEIIGNIMEISNLLNKKAVSEKDVQTDGEPTTPERHISKNEISLPMPCPPEGSDHGMTATTGFQLPKPPEPPTVEAEYYTIAEFQSNISDGISFRGGQKADVIEKNSGGWWYVQIGDLEGWAPCSYIDKRKKPNLSRRTSTLTRPKVPPPAPPVKRQDSEDTPSLSGNASKAPESPSRPVYEEPEYDIPAIGCDLDLDAEPVKKEPRPCVKIKSSKAAAERITSPLRNEDSLDSVAKEEAIYENDGLRFSSDDFAITRECGGGDSDALRSRTLGRKPLGRGRPLRDPLDLSRSQSLNRPEKASSRSSLEEPGRNPKREPVMRKDVEIRTNHSPSARPKPVVRPKPLLTKSDPQSPERMDISSLRRQLRPTGAAQWLVVRAPGCGGGLGAHVLPGARQAAPGRGPEQHQQVKQPGEERTARASPQQPQPAEPTAGGQPQPSHPPETAGRLRQTAHPPQRLGRAHAERRPPGGRATPVGVCVHAAASEGRRRVHGVLKAKRVAGPGGSSPLIAQRNGIPVSTVKPKPIEKPHLIHNNLREVYVSIADYRGDEETMGFPEGTSLEVLEKNPNGWWYCQVLDGLQGRKGWVPSNYLERKK